jgi:uncharacterized membrane protein
MPDIETFTGAHGFDLVVDTNLNLEGATDIKLRIKSPTGTTVSRSLTAANVDAPASSGIVRYVVAANDFTVPGLYKVQVSDETDGKKLTSAIVKVRSRASLEYVGS